MDIRSIPKLTMLTFLAWEKAITIALMAEGALDIVLGREEEAIEPDVTRPATEERMKEYKKECEDYDKKIFSHSVRSGKAAWMISQTLGDGVDQYIRNTNDPFVMWGLLKEAMDTRLNPVHQRIIRKQFSDLTHEGKGTIDEYINKLKEYQRALEGTPDPLLDDSLVNKIITTLPKEWDLKLRIIEDDPDLSLSKLEKILRSYQITLDARKIQDIALATKGKSGRKKGSKPVDKKVKGGKVKKDKKDIECWHCLGKGHFRDECPIKKELVRRSKERKRVKEEEEEDKANKAEDVSSDEEKALMAKHYLYDVRKPSDNWILDSGATGHMCFDRQAFESLKRLPKPRIVTLGDDTEVGAYVIGTVRLNGSMVLEDVL